MKYKGIPERWTIIGVSILMLLALGLLARVLANNKERGEALGTLALNRALDSQQQRFMLVTNTFTWDLEEEAQYLHQHDPISDADLIDRWLPVLRSRYAISSICVANDRGDERVLHHADSMWRFTKTVRTGDTALSLKAQWPLSHVPVPATDTMATEKDPRASVWFSHALEVRQDEPVWSESESAANAGTLQLSMLIRGKTDGDAYRVIRFDINADAMLAKLNQWSTDVSTMQLDSKGRPLSPIDTSLTGRAWKKALASWKNDHGSTPFQVDAGGKQWIGRIIPMELNGNRFHTGVLIGLGVIDRWNSEGRIGLWSVLVLLLLLGLLLAMVFIQSRSAERRVRRQEQRSSVQARHLARAIDEREVLDREVHHRVKNNLQVVSSLLNLQAKRVPGKDARSEFMRGKRRIDSMALVHHKLYRQTDLSAVDLGVFLEDLAKAVAAMFEPDSRSVSFNVEANGIRCDADTAIQLGMIYCELLANCHQHAFPYATGGHIEVTVRDPGDGSFILGVKDNGKGFGPEDVKDTHLGLEVVEALTDQLEGSLRTTNDNGTLVEVIFHPDRQA